MTHVLTTEFACCLADHTNEPHCPRNGECIKYKDICRYLEMKVVNPPRWPPKVVIPPSRDPISMKGASN